MKKYENIVYITINLIISNSFPSNKNITFNKIKVVI